MCSLSISFNISLTSSILFQVTPTSSAIPNGTCPHGHKFNFTLQNPVKPLWNKIRQFKAAVVAFLQNKLNMLQSSLAGGGGGQPALSAQRPPGTNSTKNLPQARATVLLVHHSCACGGGNCTCGNANCTGACC